MSNSRVGRTSPLSWEGNDDVKRSEQDDIEQTRHTLLHALSSFPCRPD